MKNLKRVLSLALATVMVIGMMVVGANATFADQSSIKYTNAVDTLVQLGVMNGMGDNTFAPNGTLTRAQAAKMVAYVKSGANATTISYYDGTTKFTDVKDNHKWASGSINYCVANGIVTGMTATTFAPDASLTGAQLAKMMLVALGYPEKSENATQTLVGANWQLNAIRLATEAGLFAGLDSNFAATRAITRQEAAQIMYNALFLNTWEIDSYQNATPIYTKTGLALIASAFKANTTIVDGKTTAGTPSNDDFQRPATKYTFKDGKKDIVVVAAPTLTYTTGVKTGDLYKALGLTTTTTANVKVDGANASPATASLTNGGTDTLGANGALTEVYNVNNTITVVTINTYVATVATVTPAKNGNPATIKLTANGTDPVKAADTYETTAFAKDDVVLYTYANSKIQSVAKANSATGALTGYTTDKNAVVGGTTYSYSAKTTDTAVSYVAVSGQDLKDDVTVYFDNYGNIIKMVQYKATETNVYAYVIAKQANTSFGVTTYQAQLLYTDGSIGVVDLADNYDMVGKVVTYTKNNNGLTVLKAAATGKEGSNKSLTIAKGKPALTLEGTTYYANNNTVFLVKTEVNGKPVYTAYTGYANVPSLKADSNAAYAVYVDKGVAAVVYVSGAAADTTASKDLIYVVGDSHVTATVDSVRGTYYTHTAVVNGKITTIDLASKVTADTLVSSITYNQHNVGTLGTAVTTKATGTVKAAAGLIGFGTDAASATYKAYTSDCVVFMINGGEVTASSVASIVTDANDTVMYQVNETGEVTAMFITVNA